MLLKISIVSLILATLSEFNKVSGQDIRHFPDDFLFGAATASYQIEGAWNVDGKSDSIWDHLTHTVPCTVADCSNGDIADNSYYLYKRDIEMLRELGVDYYRFSISWPRLLPTSFTDHVNPAGVEYYNNLINEMLKYNITPMVTLYHWELPQKLQELGGWTNPSMIDWYGDYAKIAFELFGDRVKFWITVNEPHLICHRGYGSTTMAPRLNMQGTGEYLCAKNLMLAHARAWHIYNDEYRSLQKGNISITISATWYEPESEKDAAAAEDYHQFDWGIYAHTVFSEEGGWPHLVADRIATKSELQGFARSRLPALTAEEASNLLGSSDFYGLNHYSSVYVYRNESVVGLYESPSYYDDIEAGTFRLDEWKISPNSSVNMVPWGFYKLLSKIRKDYNNPPIIITENGFATAGGLEDDDRVKYFRGYMAAMLDAIEEGSDIRAYTAWSLMDNFEWMDGYTRRFGLYEVDYESLERTRTPRKSAFVFKEILRTRSLDPNYEPTTTTITIDPGH
ncbi:hypothetical protein MSG28_002870 [Choristoneura fumiferana]|uniref:Uncharacterized protein n=1 Tax=Choristoneura fumiferana TaxID=7141 RepID=A0ACC0JJX4_CHOFU|nr:hypothetical protein MSG28_002870 [Choristoneura fumiferana]